MSETKEKYSFAEWLEGDGGRHLFPDSFMERMHRFLMPYVPQAQGIFQQHSGPWDHPVTINTEVDWEISKVQTRSVLERLSPDYAEIFDQTFNDGEVFIADVEPGKGAGRCLPKGIEYERDRTLNDVVYLSHEFGHRIWVIKGNLDQPASINEWQAFFVQHALFHTLVHNEEWGEEIAEAARNHQQQELLVLLNLFPDRLDVLSKLQKGEIPKEDQQKAEEYAIGLHKHTPAMFIALALFNKYKDATPAEQEKMRVSLFETTEDTTFETVLASFDLLDGNKLENAMRVGLRDVGITATISQPGMDNDKI